MGKEGHWYGTLTTFGVNTFDEGNLPNTNSNSINPTLATDKTSSIPAYHHLAWEQKSGSYSDIKYYKLFRDGYQKIQTSTSSPETPSSGGGFWTNIRPSIIAMDNNTPKIVWIGFAPWFSTRAVFRYKQTSGSWSSTVYSYDYDVKSVNINRTDNNQYLFGWSNSSSYSNKYVKNLGPVTSFGTTGKDIQVNNSSDFNNMFCMAFQSNITPHIFVKSASVGGGLQKISSNTVNSGRAAVVRKDGAGFSCAIGDITLNGETIGFVESKNVDRLKTRKELNQYITTKPFQLDDGSKLDLRIISGITNADSARQVLNQGKFIKFNIALVDANSGETLHSFTNLEYSDNSLKDSTGLSYSFNAKGLGKQMARVRVSLDENVSGEYAVLQLIGGGNVLSLNKQSSQEVFPEKALVITEFALGQNYPNPFNPVTHIVYDLPKDSPVNLTVYNINGAVVQTLVSGHKPAGRHKVAFDGSSLASGIYLYRIQAGSFSRVKRMLLVK
jgi:type IX secretion system substrate protein